MSVLNTARKYFGFDYTDEAAPVTHTPTLEERLGEAAADRGWAFGLIADATEALKDSALTEAEVAEESLRRAERGLAFARESAERILATGRENAARYEDQALYAQRNAVDDASAVEALARLLADEDLVAQ